jgi:hypothetical protein
MVIQRNSKIVKVDPPKKAPRREKFSIEQLTALRNEGLGVSAIAKRLNVTPGAISRRLTRLRTGLEAAKSLESHLKDPAKRWEGLEHRLMLAMDDEVIKKIPGFQKIMGAAICRDKVRLLRNQDSEKGLVHWILLIDRRRRGLPPEANGEPPAIDVKPEGEGDCGERKQLVGSGE